MELSVPTGDSGKSSWWPRPGQSSIRAIWDLHGNCGHCHGCEISWIIDRFCCTEFDVSCSITSSAKSMTEICPALHYVVGLGSNAGDSLSLLVEGRRLLVSRSGAAGLMSSALYRTAPVACASETREFLNAVIFFQSSLAPVEMLDLCQELEVELGRPREHGYHEAPDSRYGYFNGRGTGPDDPAPDSPASTGSQASFCARSDGRGCSRSQVA